LLLSPLLFLAVLNADESLGTSWMAVFWGFTLAASDVLDGHLARMRGTVSKWGAFIDPLADKVVVIGTALCLVDVQRFQLLPVLILAGREIFITLYRLQVARQGLAIPARKSAKWKTSIQGISLMIAVMPPLEESQWVVDFGIWVAVVFTVVTGIQYLMDGILATSSTGE
tara:strand:+ start:12211 stop:12720 length:510 start_codon:yes stop_codon:yes gene_type:complete